MTYLPEDELSLLGDIIERLCMCCNVTVSLYHFKCYIVRYYVGAFYAYFSLRCFQPILFGSVFIRSFSFSIGFLRVRISVKLVSLYIKWSLGLKHFVLEGVM